MYIKYDFQLIFKFLPVILWVWFPTDVHIFTCNTPSMISNWSSRKVTWLLSFLRLLIALSRTLSISSLNISIILSWDKIANSCDWAANSHSESNAAFLTSTKDIMKCSIDHRGTSTLMNDWLSLYIGKPPYHKNVQRKS